MQTKLKTSIVIDLDGGSPSIGSPRVRVERAAAALRELYQGDNTLLRLFMKEGWMRVRQEGDVSDLAPSYTRKNNFDITPTYIRRIDGTQ